MQQVRYVLTPLALGALVLGGAATASADSGEADFGTPQQVAVGPAVIAYTVGEPQPSTDQVNGPVQGQLYAVETTATAVQGMAVPEIPGQVQGRGVRARRVILRRVGSGGQCRWGGLLFCR
ncbi:MAG: DUF1942 domain-containing protein [Mycobacterium sp.]